jgi:hypothetical protein
MLSRILLPLAVAVLACGSLRASPGCDSAFVQSYHQCVRMVDSLRPDKGGQARVFASDGTEFTAEQARWMQAQLQQVDRACSRGDREEATRLLSGVQELLKAHARS